jgi:hypothetical protein
MKNRNYNQSSQGSAFGDGAAGVTAREKPWLFLFMLG